MNKTVNINLGGMFFHIDEDAYLKLTRYFDAIKRSLNNSSGQDEIIKDIEDYPGDLKQGMNTLPIVLGIETTTKVVFGLALIPTAGIIYYVLTYLYTLQGASAYILVGVVGPLIYLLIKIWSAKQKQDFSHLSKVVKIIMLLGLLSILVITLNMKYHA